MSKKQKSQARKFVNQNAIESLGNLGQGVVKAIAKDVFADSATNLWDQLLGQTHEKPKSAKSGDLREGEHLDLKSLREQEIRADIEPGIDYRREIIHAETRMSSRDNREIQVRVEEILMEIKNLAQSSRELEAEFRDAVVAQPVVKAGKYHVNFFEWMLTTIKTARARIEESIGWVSAMQGKKNKKDYWSMFKKQGTTFGLSNERVVATQTG